MAELRTQVPEWPDYSLEFVMDTSPGRGYRARTILRGHEVRVFVPTSGPWDNADAQARMLVLEAFHDMRRVDGPTA